MTYELEFDARALKEFKKLDNTIRQQFKKKLKEILILHKIAANQLRELPHCYKIKLRSSGYRMIYQVNDETITVLVVAIGKRDKSSAYKKAVTRIK